MRRIIASMMSILLTAFLMAGCKTASKNPYNKYSDSFFDTFDTMIMVVAYTKSEEEFRSYFVKIQEIFQKYHKLYDIYNDYEGINNVKTINDNAGIKPVKVDKELIDLVLFAKDWYKRTGGNANIAMGSVLKIWHDYREEGRNDPQKAKVPSSEELRKAAEHADMNKVIVDRDNGTIYLADKEMSLDVGAVAKGYVTEIAAKYVMAQGFESGIINAGGNIRVLGKPLDGVRERWGIGIHNPEKSIVSDEETNLDVVFVNNASVVSSGDYERFYVVNDKVFHHLIDPKTLMPGEYYRAVTVVTEDSGIADVLSTAVFLMPLEESKALVESLQGVDVLWVMPDGRVEATDGMKKIMKSHGATGAKGNKK